MPNPLLQSDFNRRANIYRQALDTELTFGPLGGTAEVVDALAGNDVITNERLPYAGQMGVPHSGFAIEIYNGHSLLLGNGNDTVSARGLTSGLVLSHLAAQLDAGPGNDTVIGLADANAFGFASIGVNVESEARLQLGSGNDVLTAQGADYGLLMANNPFFRFVDQARSLLDAGSGNDRLEAVGGEAGVGLLKADLITGVGNDQVQVSGEEYGAWIDEGSSILLGSGNDRFVTTGQRFGMYIIGGSHLDAGAGKDVLIASGDQVRGYSLRLETGSTILMGEGKDTVDALTGFFSCDDNSWVDLGGGNDTFKGFGDGIVRGGVGRDRLVLADGIYTVSVADAALNPLPAGFSGLQIEQGGTKLFVESMELVAGTADRQGVNLTTGILNIVGGEAVVFA